MSVAPRVPESELEISFVRSSGPGGQNINKTSTKVQLRWNVFTSTAFNETEKTVITKKLAHRMTSAGDILVFASQARSQVQNKTRAISELQQLLDGALTPEVPRISTRPTRASKEVRLKDKKKRGMIKKSRKHVDDV